MKKIYLYFLAFLLLFSACRKEEVILDDPISTTDPPVELDGFFISGQIRDNDNAKVEDAVVRFYQGGEQVGESVTDADGFYDSKDIPLLEGEEVTLAIEEETYIAKYKRTAQVNETEKIDLRLIKKGGASPGQNEVLKNPGDPALVKIQGTFTDINGDPLSDAFVVLAWEFDKPTSSSLKFEGVTDLTDENGYIELLVPPGEEVFFFSLPWYESNTYSCVEYLSAQEENILDFGLYWENLGIITEGQELIEQEGIDLSSYNYIFYGVFQNCDGSPVESGQGLLKVSYVDNDGETVNTGFTTTEFGPNGEYEFNFNRCGYDGEMDVELTLVNEENFGVKVEAQDVSGLHFAPLKACDDFNEEVLTSELNLNIGADYSFNFVSEHPVPADPTQIQFFSSHDDITGFVNFQMPDVVLGENTIQFLEVGYLSFGNADPFKFAAFETLKAEITDISNGQIIGTFQGDVETAELGTQEVSGDFVISYE